MIDYSRYTVFNGSDGRVRAFDKQTQSTVSFPRLIMEDYLGRELLKTEDVHHKDGNPLNNEISNLEVIDRKEHLKQHAEKVKQHYEDKEMVCPVCNKSFLWTAKQQHNKHRREALHGYKSAGPFCSKQCRGLYGASKQHKQEYSERKFPPQKVICPVCEKEFTWSYTSQLHYSRGEVELPQPCCSLKCMHALRRQSEEYTSITNMIYQAMKETHGSVAQTSRKLGISHKTIYTRLKQANLPYLKKDYN